jgi:hypothetical protein
MSPVLNVISIFIKCKVVIIKVNIRSVIINKVDISRVIINKVDISRVIISKAKSL